MTLGLDSRVRGNDLKKRARTESKKRCDES
jgi:hypothetical protein